LTIPSDCLLAVWPPRRGKQIVRAFFEEISMCFSAEASFGLSAMLLPAGIYCVKSALAKNRAFLCLAVIPWIFGVQQFAEGVVWMGLRRHDAQLTRAASLVFLAFAFALWPFWIPLCAFILEPNAKKKWLLGWLALVGLTGGLVLYFGAVLNSEVLQTRQVNHSIDYDIGPSPVFPWMPLGIWQLLYVVVVAVPPLMSRTNGFFLFSVAIVLSAAVSHSVFWYASASVWCFFAATLSLYLCVSFHGLPVLIPAAKG
jgi:hypothetical protein